MTDVLLLLIGLPVTANVLGAPVVALNVLNEREKSVTRTLIGTGTGGDAADPLKGDEALVLREGEMIELERLL